ncbi:MAG: Ldh family oxidoreductase [Minwuia sp.]|uniref:Ldh family oxidoreductase n=1 Tax=Minwuia sp. TaxID=2493630 RepID=UPI003A875DA0
MHGLGAAIFEAAGSSAKEARTIIERLAGANLRGHDSHGVIRIPRYVQWAADGLQVPNQTAEILSEQPGFAIVDGRYGFGQSIGEQAVDIGIAKARTQGVAMVALRNSGHLGRIGDWAERAADAGLVSMHMVNVRGSLLVAPFGGVSRRSSTNPFCIGAPVAGADHIVLDFATSLVAEGKALVALKGGKPLPPGAIVAGDGTITSDPAPLYGETGNTIYPDPSQGPGALRAFGDHKGFGMNFMMEVMAGALTGSGTAGALGEDQRRRFCNGMLSIYIDLDAMGGAPREMGDSFAAEVLAYVDFVKSATPAEAGGEVLVPGEPERRLKAEREATGLPLAPQAWADILATAERMKIDPARFGV